MEDLELDKAELQSFLAQTTRPGVREILNRAIQETHGKILLAKHDEEENKKAREHAKKIAEKEEKKADVDYQTLGSYSWEDAGKFVKVYVTGLEGIKDVPADDVICEFSPTGFEFKVRGL